MRRINEEGALKGKSVKAFPARATDAGSISSCFSNPGRYRLKPFISSLQLVIAMGFKVSYAALLITPGTSYGKLWYK